MTIRWKQGLHLRPAAKIVKCAQSFSSSISLRVNERFADARSIFGILLLSATLGVTVDVEATGTDEEAAISTMSSIFESGDAVYVETGSSDSTDASDIVYERRKR